MHARMISAAIGSAVMATLALQAQAQATIEPTLVMSAQPSAPAPGPTHEELRALTFYMQQRDGLSANAELRRLRVKFPTWTPPTDLGALQMEQPSVEIDTIFRQIAVGQLAEARATIAVTRAAYKGWTPPVDMMTLLGLAEGQVKLDAALDAGNADAAVEIAIGTDGLLRCDRINNAWRIAEAQLGQKAREASVRTYKAIVTACETYPELFATIEKSDVVTTTDELAGLVEVVMKRFPDKQTDLKDLQSRLLAGRDGSGATRSGPEAGGELATSIRPMPRPDRRAKAASPAASVASAPAPAPRKPKVSANWTECLAQTEGTRDAQMLFSRGWCAYNLERPMDSLAAFQAVEGLLAPAQRRDARFGMALSFLKLNMTEDAARVAATTDLTAKQRIETESIILDQRGVRSYKLGEFDKAIGYFTALEQVSGSLRRDLSIMRGYAYLNTGRRTIAFDIFQTLHNQLATRETAHGMELAKSS